MLSRVCKGAHIDVRYLNSYNYTDIEILSDSSMTITEMKEGDIGSRFYSCDIKSDKSLFLSSLASNFQSMLTRNNTYL